MKHTIKYLLPFLMIAGMLTGCGSQTSENTSSIAAETAQATEAAETSAVTEQETQAENTDRSDIVTEAPEENYGESTDNNILVVYFTPAENSGVDAISSATVTTWNGEEMGAAEVLANMIQHNTDSDMFSIQTAVNYPLDYDELADYAKNEQDNDILPELTSHIDNMEQYDTIFVVYPAWWYTMPQAVYSFFNEYDLSGKTVIPCATHAGSRLAGAPSTIEGLEPNATVISDGFSVPASDVADAENDVIEWLGQLGY